MNTGTLTNIQKEQKIFIPAISTVHAINVHQIIRVQSMSNYSKLYFSNGKTLVVAKVLRWFEENLPPEDFIRVHRTHLINAGYISEYRGDNHCRKLELTNGEQIEVSKRRKAEFLKIFRSY